MQIWENKVDMLHGAPAKSLLRFTLPIALSSMLQQLFSAADTAVAGRFGSPDALAAVGANTETAALIVTLSVGLSAGVNLLVARRIGQGRDCRGAVGTAMVLAAVLGAMGCLGGLAAARPLLRLLRTPESIFHQAEVYLRVYLLGYPFLLVYDFGAAVLRARGDSRWPFWALLVSGTVNVGLNLLFTAGLGMDVAGVAAATALSTALSALLVVRRLRGLGLLGRCAAGTWKDMGEMLQTGVPAALQGAVFCFANLFVQTAVNQFGKTAVAGSMIAMNFEYFTYYIITAFGQSAATFIGQNCAAGDYRRCRRILWAALGLSAVCSAVPIFTIVRFRGAFAALFTAEQAVVESAAVRMVCILLPEPLCCLYEIPAGVLRGSGHPVYPAAATAAGTCAVRIVWIFTVFRHRPALPVLYGAFSCSWAVTALLVGVGFLLLPGFWKGRAEAPKMSTMEKQ